MPWQPSNTDINQPDALAVKQTFSYGIQYIDSKTGSPRPITLTATTQSFSSIVLINGTTAAISGYYPYVFDQSVIKYKQTEDDDNSIQTISQGNILTDIWDIDFTESDVYAMTSFKADRTLYHYYNYMAMAIDTQTGPQTITYKVTLTNFWDVGKALFKEAVLNSKQVKTEGS
jgi:hypothetical protein